MINPDQAGVDVNSPQTQQMAAEYARLSKEMRGTSGPEESGLRRQRSRLGRDYKAQTGGRSLRDDQEVINAAQAFASHGSRLDSAGSEAGWATMFADMGADNKFDYMPTIVALKTLAGGDETLVHDISLQGEDIQLRAVDEGSLQHPSSRV